MLLASLLHSINYFEIELRDFLVYYTDFMSYSIKCDFVILNKTLALCYWHLYSAPSISKGEVFIINVGGESNGELRRKTPLKK